MSQKERAELQAMLAADPALNVAWTDFLDAVAADAKHIKQGAPSTHQTTAKAMQRVMDVMRDRGGRLTESQPPRMGEETAPDV